MKKQIILGSLLAWATIGNSQIYAPSGVITGATTGGGASTNVGIGGSGAVQQLHLVSNSNVNNGASGAIFQNTGTWAALLELKTTGGGDYGIYASGSGNPVGRRHFSIYDYRKSIDRLFIQDSTGNVGIGTTSPAAKLHVVNTPAGSDAYGIVSEATSSGGWQSLSIKGVADASGGGGQANGVFGYGMGSTVLNSGGTFFAYPGPGGGGGTTNYGVVGGVAGNLTGGVNIAVYAELPVGLSSGGNNYGIYSDVGGPNSGSPNNGGLGPCYAGYFNGDIVTMQGSYLYSDKRLKKDIVTISNSLDVIKKLNPVNYNFDVAANPQIALPHEKQYGFISQEIQQVLPEFTKTVIHPAKLDNKGKEIYPKKEVLALNYNGFIALLTKGMQEQQQQIESLKQELEAFKTGSATGINQTNNTPDGFALDQNIPNPFSSETVINYTLPQQVKSASMIVYDLSGKQIASFPLEKSNTSISITSEKLAAGIYIYSVMADGKILDSKRMVVAEKQ